MAPQRSDLNNAPAGGVGAPGAPNRPAADDLRIMDDYELKRYAQFARRSEEAEASDPEFARLKQAVREAAAILAQTHALDPDQVREATAARDKAIQEFERYYHSR